MHAYFYLSLMKSRYIWSVFVEKSHDSKMNITKNSISNLDSAKKYSIIPKLIRGGFLIFGVGFVVYGFYRTMHKVSQRNILIREEVVVKEKYTYPSITFCYKYKNGGKDVFRNYYPPLYDKWKKSGMVYQSIKA